MGAQRSYLPSGGFKEYLYHQIGDTITANGISGKVIAKVGGAPGHDGLPMYSNTSKVYFKLDDDGKIEQARIYDGRKAVFDIDWGHNHYGFKIGTVHIHEFTYTSNGELNRKQQKVRYLNNKEMKRYGALLKKANPSIKFR